MKGTSGPKESSSWTGLHQLFGSGIAAQDRRQAVRRLLTGEGPGVEGGSGDEPADAARYDAVFDNATRELDALRRQLAEERRAAGRLWTLLQGHPQARRLVMIRNDRRFQTWGFFQCLLQRVREVAPYDPQSAHEIAGLALTVAENLDPERYGEERIADFHAAALAALGGARRRLSDLEGAQTAFEQALERLEDGTGDPLERAELESLRAQLLHDLGDDQEAERSLRRSRFLCRRIGNPPLGDGVSPTESTPGRHRRHGAR